MQELAGFATIVGILIASLSGFYWRLNKSIVAVSKSIEYKENRIYERMDAKIGRIENVTKSDFVNKDVCKIITAQNNNQFEKIDKSLAVLTRDIKELVLEIKKRGCNDKR